MDDLAELVKRAESAEQAVAVLTAQNRQLTALVTGMQGQLAKALGDLRKALVELDSRRKKQDPKRDEPEEEPSDEGSPQPPNGGVGAPPDPPRKPPEPATPKGKPRRPPALPAHLPRHVVKIPVLRCNQCGGEDLAGVGDGEVSERYDYVPAQIRVERIERATCRCRACGTFTTAPLPPVPVPGGMMTAALLAHIAYSKCCLHLTLDRTADDLRRLGADFADSTMCDAMGHIANLLEPVCDRIVDDLFVSGLLHLDGTGVKVLMPGESGSYRGQFTVLSNAEATAYFFSETKAGEHLADFLRVGTPRAYRGYLVADAASNMDVLYTDGAIVECGCWYHARDKFENAQVSAPIEAAEAIAWIKALFEVEHEADAAGDTVSQRKARRGINSQPVLDGFRAWMAKTQPRFDPDEDLWKAVQYCNNHWDALTRFLLDGRIPLTNNQAERDLGPIGRGRKAWLFAGSDNGGHRLAAIYTVVGTCLRQGIDPILYLTDVLPRLSSMPVNRGRGHLNTLLPEAWKASRALASVPPDTS